MEYPKRRNIHKKDLLRVDAALVPVAVVNHIVSHEGGQNDRSFANSLPMTKNITELFQRYRQCLREIWNTDLRYYIAEITEFPSRPDLAGRQVLIDVCQADIVWSSTAEDG